MERQLAMVADTAPSAAAAQAPVAPAEATEALLLPAIASVDAQWPRDPAEVARQDSDPPPPRRRD